MADWAANVNGTEFVSSRGGHNDAVSGPHERRLRPPWTGSWPVRFGHGHPET